MKKVTHATLTLIILYGITFFLILAISLLFDVELLFSLLGFEIIATVFAVLLIFSNRRYEVKVI